MVDRKHHSQTRILVSRLGRFNDFPFDEHDLRSASHPPAGGRGRCANCHPWIPPPLLHRCRV